MLTRPRPRLPPTARILHTFTQYEHMCLEALLTTGHASAAAKVGVGVRAFQAKIYQTGTSASLRVRPRVLHTRG